MASTTLTSWALLIWQTLKEKGINPRDVFIGADLDPAKLGDSNARYPISGMMRLWEASQAAYGDETFGFEVGKHWNITTYHALGFAWLASDSLLEGMSRLARYARLVNNYVDVQLHQEHADFVFSISSFETPDFFHPMASDAANVAVLKMCRMLYGESFSPIEVCVERSRPAVAAIFENEFRAPYVFDCPANRWTIHRQDMQRRLPTGNAELANANEQLALNYLNNIEKQFIEPRVRKIITETLPNGVASEEKIAEMLNLSVRSMQRKLHDEGYKYSGLVMDVRRSLAEIYIKNSRLSLNEIAYLLGFSEPASFSRAFRRWTGESPSHFRKELQAIEIVA